MSAVLQLKRGNMRDDVSRVQDPDSRGHRIMLKWAPYRRDARRVIDAPRDGKMAWKDRAEIAFDAEPEWVVPVDRAIASHAAYARASGSAPGDTDAF